MRPAGQPEFPGWPSSLGPYASSERTTGGYFEGTTVRDHVIGRPAGPAWAVRSRRGHAASLPRIGARWDDCEPQVRTAGWLGACLEIRAREDATAAGGLAGSR